MAIDLGYRVHALFRKLKSLKAFLEALPPEYHEHMKYTLVPTLVAEFDPDPLLADADYVIHMSTPPPWTPDHVCYSDTTIGKKQNMLKQLQPQINYQWQFVHPVSVTTYLLLSAAGTCPSMKRVVLTSSITPFFDLKELDGNQAVVRSIEDEDQEFPGPLGSELGHKLGAYAAGKAESLRLSRTFVENHPNLHFDIVSLMPSNVFGPNRMCKSREEFNRGSNAILLNHLLGVSKERLFSGSVHIDDVARCHVEALLPCIPPGRYILNSGYTHWPNAIGFVEKYHPDMVGPVFAKDPPTEITHCVIKKPKTRRAFALGFKQFEEQVKDTVDFYLSLPPGNESKSNGQAGVETAETKTSSALL
ncbi:hypothetical protein F4861DRAFT_501804 [Xylaria intraflava]|nr:hypothetical protein F4861DRAFT_501804 [Xylaria intraflava]